MNWFQFMLFVQYTNSITVKACMVAAFTWLRFVILTSSPSGVMKRLTYPMWTIEEHMNRIEPGRFLMYSSELKSTCPLPVFSNFETSMRPFEAQFFRKASESVAV